MSWVNSDLGRREKNGDVMLRVGGTYGGFNKLDTLSSISFSVGQKRVFKLVNPGKTKGAAVFGLVASVFAPASNRVVFGRSGVGNLGPRLVAGGNVYEAFRGVHLFPRVATRRGIVIKRRYQDGSKIFDDMFEAGSRQGRRREVHDGTGRLLRFIKLKNFTSVISSDLTCNRREELRVTETLTDSPRLLLLSRPTTKVGRARADRLFRLVGGVRRRNIAILLVRRSVPLIVGLYSHVTILGFNGGVTRKAPTRVRGGSSIVRTCLNDRRRSLCTWNGQSWHLL